MNEDPFANPVSRLVWETKYRDRDHDATIRDTWRRVARAIAAVEADPDHWAGRFAALLENFGYLPGGRILAGAGVAREVTLFNCFVMGVIEDSMEGIFDALKEGALTMQAGGGVGYDFSTLRPRGCHTRRVGGIASGPVSFMRIWDAMCATILSTGARRGAMMATLRCDHPDIEEFVTAKQRPGELTRFNLSVLVSDALLEAVERDDDWPLVFPRAGLADEDAAGRPVIELPWSQDLSPVPCVVLRTVRARALWDLLMRATFDHAEPGVLFVDRINRMNNLYWRERISATNPCGEVPLPPYGACDLGSLNLVRHVRDPFTSRARLDLEALAAEVPMAVRFMDNVIDVSRFPLPAQAERERGCRRIGLGITGLADALIMLGLDYDSDVARELAGRVMRTLRDAAYRASVQLAQEKGPFPQFEREPYLDGAFVRELPPDIRDGIARHGIRNSHLLAIAPTGTISLLANNVSSGIEPVFAAEYRRRVTLEDGTVREFDLLDRAVALWRAQGNQGLPPAFVDALSLSPEAHLAMQAELQPYVDNAISKTINVPADFPYERFRDLYRRAWQLGLKGCTTYRPNSVTGAVLEPVRPPATHCCSLDREAD